MSEKAESNTNVVKPGHAKWNVVDALAEWVIRVTSSKTASDKELDKLPEVVNALTHLVNDGKNYH